jgi:cytochrome c-type biogenesis protein
MSFQELTASDEDAKSYSRRLAIGHSLLFIAGFSIFFIALGASASVVGQVLREHQKIVRIAGGILIIIFGLIIAGVLRLPFLMKDRRIQLKNKPTGFLGSILVGFTFSAGWTACGAPLLGSMLALSSQAATVWRGVFLLSGFSLGLALPFFLSAIALTSFLAFFTKFRRFIGLVEKICGVLLILVGFLLLTNSFNVLARYFSKLLP